jgi:hypothetical protein
MKEPLPLKEVARKLGAVLQDALAAGVDLGREREVHIVF